MCCWLENIEEMAHHIVHVYDDESSVLPYDTYMALSPGGVWNCLLKSNIGHDWNASRKINTTNSHTQHPFYLILYYMK